MNVILMFGYIYDYYTNLYLMCIGIFQILRLQVPFDVLKIPKIIIFVRSFQIKPKVIELNFILIIILTYYANISS